MAYQERILLVEDEPDIADMLRLFFDWQGYEFHHAADGAEALDLASRVLPHVILMDVSLPDTDGYTLTVQLRWRPRTAHIPIIILSKWGSRGERLLGLEMGAEDYLAKPFDLQELLLRVQNSIARAARERLTDLRTGFPAAFTARPWLEKARADPQQAIIEIELENATPYRDAYGSAACAEVYCAIGQLLLAVANRHGSPQDFVGYLDEDHFVILTARACAEAMAGQIAAVFNDSAARYYSEDDRQRGGLVQGDSPCGFMRLRCRITTGEDRVEVL